MKTFEEYLEKMGYSWNDFDRTYEMENLIEQYADEKIKQALTIPAVVRSAFIDVKKVQEQFSIDCKKFIESKPYQDMIKALKRAGAF